MYNQITQYVIIMLHRYYFIIYVSFPVRKRKRDIKIINFLFSICKHNSQKYSNMSSTPKIVKSDGLIRLRTILTRSESTLN